LRSLRVCILSLLLLLLRVSELSETLICSLSSVSLSSFFEFLQGILNSLPSKNKKKSFIFSLPKCHFIYFSSSFLAALTGEFSFEANLKLLIKSGFLMTRLSLLFLVAVNGILPFNSST